MKPVDSIQQRLTTYARELAYGDLPANVVHAAKVRIIDTLGALICGFFGEPCRIARAVAARMPNTNGATVIGTRYKTTVDLAAFVNATTARYPELADAYHRHGSFGGHPSDTLMSVFAMGEHVRANGRDLIAAVVLAFEVYQRINDVFDNRGYDNTTISALAIAIGAGRLLQLTEAELSHCIAMAIVPNNMLRQVRTGELSMFKEAAAGQAGRAGVFAALLAKAGMEGPNLPFEGKAGWCDHVAKKRFALDMMGGDGVPFIIPDTLIKLRPCAANTIPAVLAAEKLVPVGSVNDIERITVEVYERGIRHGATGEHFWNPRCREDADHSIPYVTAVTLIDGTVTLRSYDQTHLDSAELHALMKKIDVIENTEFTRLFEQVPQQHRTRITIVMRNGQTVTAESGGDQDDLSSPRSDAQISAKFRGLTKELLGARRSDSILDRLWHLDDMKDVAEIPPAFVLD
jgi:2-methylcitrate dehydratase